MGPWVGRDGIGSSFGGGEVYAVPVAADFAGTLIPAGSCPVVDPAANVEATRRLTVAFRTNKDNIMPGVAGDMLLVPTNLNEQAYELISSSGKVDTAQNNLNFHKGRYSLVVWDQWLTDTNNWFMLNSRLTDEYLHFLEWNPTEFFYAGEMDTLVSKHAAYMSINTSAVEWRFAYGHLVS